LLAGIPTGIVDSLVLDARHAGFWPSCFWCSGERRLGWWLFWARSAQLRCRWSY